MPMLHEQVGMRIGLTLTDQTLPSKKQVESFLEVNHSDFVGVDGSTGYAQIISVLRQAGGAGEFVRCTEVPVKDWDKATNPNSMYNGSATNPVFSTQNGQLVVQPAEIGDVIRVNFIGTISVDADQTSIDSVPKSVEQAVIAHAVKQSATMLSAHYAQEEDPISQSLMAIAQMAQQEYTNAFNGLLRKSKIRGNIS